MLPVLKRKTTVFLIEDFIYIFLNQKIPLLPKSPIDHILTLSLSLLIGMFSKHSGNADCHREMFIFAYNKSKSLS